MRPNVGLVLGSSMPPEGLQQAAATAEGLGLDEVWLSEDYFFTGGIAGAAGALAATSSVHVGLGVVSAMTRHPALLAMELATLERQFPGRLRPGIGLGVPAWLRQMEVMPASPVAAMEEAVTTIRRLLQGETVTSPDGHFPAHDIRLTYPLDDVPPLTMGVSGPKMLELSGRVADASVLSVSAGEAYIRWARERVEAGQHQAGRDGHHRLTVFALCAVDEDGQRARDAVRPYLAFYRAAGGANALTDVYGISDELQAMLAEGGADHLERVMPEQWLEDLTIAGTPEECAAKIQDFHEAGADAVALFPTPPEAGPRIIDLVGQRVLPILEG